MKETLERERKLAVDDDFTLPALQVATTPRHLRDTITGELAAHESSDGGVRHNSRHVAAIACS